MQRTLVAVTHFEESGPVRSILWPELAMEHLSCVFFSCVIYSRLLHTFKGFKGWLSHGKY